MKKNKKQLSLKNNSKSITVPHQYSKTDLLLAIYIGAIVAAELMGTKLFNIFGINASIAIFIFPITFSINDIITEALGKDRAISFVRTGWVVLVLLFLYSLLATSLPPASRFTFNEEYTLVFAKSRRIILASLTAFWISERFDIWVFTHIRSKLNKYGLWLRNNGSNFIGQFFDTTLFMFLAFYSPGNFGFMWSLIIPYWLLKCLMSVIETPFVYWGVNWLKKEK